MAANDHCTHPGRAIRLCRGVAMLAALTVLLAGIAAPAGCQPRDRTAKAEELPVCTGPECGLGGGAHAAGPSIDALMGADLLNPDAGGAGLGAWAETTPDDWATPSGPTASPLPERPAGQVRAARGKDRHDTRTPHWLLALGLETNDNVPTVSDELATRVGDTRDYHVFTRLSAQTPLVTGSHTLLVGEAGLYTNNYHRLDTYELNQWQAALTWTRRHRRYRWQLRPWVNALALDHRPFVDRRGLDLTWTQRPTGNRWWELRTSLAASDYRYEQANPAQDRSGRDTVVAARHYWHGNAGHSRRLVIGLGVETGQTVARGDDYDAQSRTVHGLAVTEWSPRLTVSAQLGYSARDYRHANSRDTAGRARRDREWSTGVRAAFKLRTDTHVVLHASDRVNGSNLSDWFAYRCRTAGLSLEIGF